MTIMDIVADLTTVASRLPVNSREFKSCTIAGAFLLVIREEGSDSPHHRALTGILEMTGS